MEKYSFLRNENRISYCFVLFFSCIVINIQTSDRGVIKDPVIEMNSSFPPPPENSPISSGSVANCHRAHQGVFNAIVHCLEERGDFVKVSFDNVKYNNSSDPAENSFWAYKKNIIPIHQLRDREVVESIPNQAYAEEPTITLVYPSGKYSVGTRFRRQIKKDTPTHFAVIKADFVENSTEIDLISRQDAIEEKLQNEYEQRLLFVKSINDLMDRVAKQPDNQVIPYVWGGNSFVYTYTDTGSYQEDGAWKRVGENDPYTGYDCSGLVMRIAQIAGIDFPWKTTTAIESAQKAMTHDDVLENGDLIWIQGHIMIITDIANNELVEARGYRSGYGCVHKIHLDKAFENITTYDDLLADYMADKPLRLKNKEGEFYLERKFKILKLI